MITKDVKGQYDEFIQSVNKLLGYEKGSKDEIFDIDGYFTALELIKDKVTKEGEDPYFLILPNDEPLLKIDANTRKIDTKGWEAGIGTQGDELAEIIYFSIDRYFDTTDLYDKDIFVQWENAVGDKGLSVIINKTVNYVPNKLVFGWPITSDITKSAGNVKFAVRFYTRNKPSSGEGYQLIYSLGTITATLKVNPSLDMSIENPGATDYIVINKNQIIYDMMHNSSMPGLEVTAVAPIFETPTPAFDKPFNLSDKEQLPFKIRAKFNREDDKSGMGVISYSWYRLDKNQENKIALNKADGVLDVYTENTDTERDEFDHYYTKNAKGEYITYAGSFPPGDGVEVYKLLTTLTPNKAGYYYAVATNTAGRGNQKESESGRWLIAFAKDPQFEYPNGIKNTIIPAPGESAILSPTVTVSDNGELSYQWYRRITTDKDPEKLIGRTEASLSATEEGYYSLKVTNKKNESIAVVMSDNMRVTFPASELPEQVTFVTEAGSSASGGNISRVPKNSTMSVTHEQLTRSDRISYQWKNEDGQIEGANTDRCEVTKGGSYTVTITNYYNENYIDKQYSIFISLAE